MFVEDNAFNKHFLGHIFLIVFFLCRFSNPKLSHIVDAMLSFWEVRSFATPHFCFVNDFFFLSSTVLLGLAVQRVLFDNADYWFTILPLSILKIINISSVITHSSSAFFGWKAIKRAAAFTFQKFSLNIHRVPSLQLIVGHIKTMYNIFEFNFFYKILFHLWSYPLSNPSLPLLTYVQTFS